MERKFPYFIQSDKMLVQNVYAYGNIQSNDYENSPNIF